MPTMRWKNKCLERQTTNRKDRDGWKGNLGMTDRQAGRQVYKETVL